MSAAPVVSFIGATVGSYMSPRLSMIIERRWAARWWIGGTAYTTRNKLADENYANDARQAAAAAAAALSQLLKPSRDAWDDELDGWMDRCRAASGMAPVAADSLLDACNTQHHRQCQWNVRRRWIRSCAVPQDVGRGGKWQTSASSRKNVWNLSDNAVIFVLVFRGGKILTSWLRTRNMTVLISVL